MPLTFTPGQFRRRSEFYHQLGQLTAAGISLPAALEQLRRNPPARSYHQPITTILRELNDGLTFTESIQRLGSWLPGFDLALLQAGEQSGRLDACFRLLAEYYADRARIAGQLITDLAYPVFMLHFAVLVFSFVSVVGSQNWTLGAVQIAVVLVPIYVLVCLGIYVAQSAHGEPWRAVVERLVHPVPMLGTARRYLALGRLAAALEALLSAGVSIIEAWELAATASGSPALRRTVFAWRPLVEAGETPAEALTASGRFPEVFANQYATGELSGQLDETLGRLHHYYQEEGTRKLRAFAQWTPRLLYLVVVLLIAWFIVRFYVNYFRQIGAAAGF
ncbi:MAG TPA: type II secretion system F family protein [Verrucomicrobiae bacterium]